MTIIEELRINRESAAEIRQDCCLSRRSPRLPRRGGAETVGLYDVSRNAVTRFYENGGSGALVAGPELVLPRRGMIISVR